MTGRLRAWCTLGVFVLATLPYVNGLRNGFTFDDVRIAAENQRIRSIAGIAGLFTTDWWDGRHPQSLVYRPLTITTFAIDYALATQGETDPPPARLPQRAARAFHVQNVLWHGAASAGLFLLFLELFASPGLALAAAALFAVHPVHTEAVDGIVGRAELMSACFAFLALLGAWRVVRDDPPGAFRPVLAAVLLFLALLSKEQAMVIPAVPLLWLLAPGRNERRALIRRSSFRRLMGCLAAALLAYLALRAAVLGSPLAVGAIERVRVVVDNPVSKADGAARLLTPVRVFGETLRVLIFPKTLSADYSFDQIPLVTSLDSATIGCALALSGLAVGTFLLRRRAPAASFGIGFFLLSWALTSNLPVVIGTIFGERLLYLPSAGACLAIAFALIAASRRVGAPRLAAVLVAALVGVAGARTWARNADWKDNQTLFAAAAEASPRSCKALNGYASELFTARRPEEAIPWAERSLAIYPSYPSAHLTLAKSLRAVANESSARARTSELRARASEHARWLVAFYSSTTGDGSGLADAWNVLGSLALDEKRVDDALLDFQKSVKASPDYVPAIIGLGAAFGMQVHLTSDPAAKDRLRETALAQFERALSLDPGSAEAQQDAAAMLRSLAPRTGDEVRRTELLGRADAHEVRAFAARKEAGDAKALANLHGVSGTRLLGEKRLDEALAEFKAAARLQPEAARGFLGIGTVLVAHADQEADAGQKSALIDEAIRSFEHALELEPDNPSAHLNLGITYLTRRRDPEKVAEQFRSYLRLVPDAPQRAQMEATIRQMETTQGR